MFIIVLNGRREVKCRSEVKVEERFMESVIGKLLVFGLVWISIFFGFGRV